MSGVLVAFASVVAVTALAGCGGSSGDDGGIPAELVGEYTTTLEPSDLPDDPAPELTDGGPDWKLRILTSGGPTTAPALVIESADESFGNLEAVALRVEGDTLFLDDEECGAGGSTTFYDNEYGWALDGSTLTITPVVNQCEDEVALTILTSRPWTKTG